MKTLIKNALKGWGGAIILVILSPLIFSNFHADSPFFEMLLSGLVISFLPGILGGVLGGKFINDKWGNWLGGFIFQMVLFTFFNSQ